MYQPSTIPVPCTQWGPEEGSLPQIDYPPTIPTAFSYGVPLHTESGLDSDVSGDVCLLRWGYKGHKQMNG